MLDEIVRDGTRAMLTAALRAEVAAYVEASPARSTRTVVPRRLGLNRRSRSFGSSFRLRAIQNRMHLDVRCDPGEDLEDRVAWAAASASGYADVILAATLLTTGGRLWTRDKRLATVADQLRLASNNGHEPDRATLASRSPPATGTEWPGGARRP